MGLKSMGFAINFKLNLQLQGLKENTVKAHKQNTMW